MDFGRDNFRETLRFQLPSLGLSNLAPCPKALSEDNLGGSASARCSFAPVNRLRFPLQVTSAFSHSDHGSLTLLPFAHLATRAVQIFLLHLHQLINQPALAFLASLQHGARKLCCIRSTFSTRPRRAGLSGPSLIRTHPRVLRSEICQFCLTRSGC